MRLNTRIALAIGCVSLLAFIVPAFGAPAPKGAEKHIARAHAPAQKPKAAQLAKTQSCAALRRSSRQQAGHRAATGAAPRLADPCRRGAQISRHQSHRAQKAVVRDLHEFRARQGRLCRHQFRRRQIICPVRPPHFLAADRRHRRAHARQARRPCRRGHRHRPARQSDHHFRQPRSSRRRGDLSAARG